MNKLQQMLTAIYRRLRGSYESAELKPLISATVPNCVVIRNTMDSEPEATVIASLIEISEVPEYLHMISAGDDEIMRDDFLPFIGRLLVRSSYSAGDQIFLPPRGYCQEAVIVTSGYAIQLQPGEKRKVKIPEIGMPDQESLQDIIAMMRS